MLLRAYELWDSLERESGRSLLTITGGLMIGTPESDVVRGSLRSAREHGLAHEMLDAAEIRRRFPPFTPHPVTWRSYEERAGVVVPEEAIHAHLDRPTATVPTCSSTSASSTGRRGRPAMLKCARRAARYEAARLVVAPGAWAPSCSSRLPLEVEPQVLYWFDPPGGPAPFAPDDFRSTSGIWATACSSTGSRRRRGPVKVAFFQTTRLTERGRDAGCAGALPAVLAAGDACRDRDLPVHADARPSFRDRSPPGSPQVVIASPCSGHGYKFASVIGEILADLAIDGVTRHPIGLFAPARLKDSPS